MIRLTYPALSGVRHFMSCGDTISHWTHSRKWPNLLFGVPFDTITKRREDFPSVIERRRVFSTSKNLITSLVFISLAACGGGASGFDVEPPGGGTGGWTPGVFLAASTFINMCAAPRSGIDPATGGAYPDVLRPGLDAADGAPRLGLFDIRRHGDVVAPEDAVADAADFRRFHRR